VELWSNVLVHVDGRPETSAALKKSLHVAEAFGGRVIAFDSVDPSAEQLPLRFPSLRVDHLVEFAAAERAEQLRAELARLAQPVPVEAIVGRGAPGRALLDCAASQNGGLIVKATSAADIRKQTLSGTTALHLLRGSHIPVWLYAPPRRKSHRVLAAVDLSPSRSENASLREQVLLAAAWLSLLEGAELHVVGLTAQEPARPPASRAARRSSEPREALRQTLTDLITRIGPRAVPHLVEGPPLDELERLALELEADAVTLGRDDSSEAFDADFAEHLFCRLDRSLLLVPQEPEPVRSRVHPRERPSLFPPESCNVKLG